MAPKFEDAPGLVVRERRDGTFTAFWQCRSDLAAKGFVPKIVPLWRGSEPSEADRNFVSDQCKACQADMLVFGRGGVPVSETYDGTIRTLIRCFRTDQDSPYAKLRHHSRKTYDYMLKYIDQDHGDKAIKDLKPRDLRRWHEAWAARGVTTAHGLIGQFRGLLSFGASILECENCLTFKAKIADMRFAQAKPRTSVLTADMAQAIIAEAHKRGLHAIALAQAIQFDGMLRQKDIIGEWVPIDEPGPLSEVTYRGMKSVRGIRWEEIDENLVLRHITSKRQKEVEIRLADAPMVVAALAQVERKASGPLIVSEHTGRPYSVTHFRQLWREIADACGIPKNIRNQDSRAGAITEATQAGADLESIKHAATHSDIAMTQRYARSSADKTAKVLQMRAAHRTKTS